MTDEYEDFATEPIGGGNPYHRCTHCQRSVPEINYRLEGHLKSCLYRVTKENGLIYDPNNPYNEDDRAAEEASLMPPAPEEEP